MGRITFKSTAEEVEDFILFHKYIATDENYDTDIESFLVQAENIVDSISKDGPVPKELISKLIELVGDEYDG